MSRGLVISGGFGNLLVREKQGEKLELGELLIAEAGSEKFLLQVFDLVYGSQLSQQGLELVSGLKLEEDSNLMLLDRRLRSYVVARLKGLLTIRQEKPFAPKSLPDFFSEVRTVTSEDLKFLTLPSNPLYIGDLRSGSKTLDVKIHIDGKQALSHHLLIVGTTGRGKSVLMSDLLWNTLDKEYCAMLVLDPHDEYYGRSREGLKDHPLAREKLSYYTVRNPPAGAKTLKINLSRLEPKHFEGVLLFSDAQQQFMNGCHRQYRENWIEAAVTEKTVQGDYHQATAAVVKRRLMQILDLEVVEGNVYSRGVFDTNLGQTTVTDIINELDNGKTVVIDTSEFAGSVEILIASVLAGEILERHKRAKSEELERLPVVSIVLEEAPRVLGKEVIERGPNVFATIAREGRKFKVGLTAITQLPSLIPREILANINTKIILGVELRQERQAVIESAAQDLSEDERTIASLDKGEAIITSNFISFATPVKIPLFSELVKAEKALRTRPAFGGMAQ